MFRLHERTRFFFCRAGFLILCLGPTLFLAAAAAHYRSPTYLAAQREEWTAVLSDKLGVGVRFTRLSYPLWDTAVLEELQLLDPETGEEVLSARYVEIRRENAQWRIEAGQPEINAAALPELIRMMNDRLLRGHALQLAPLRFESRETTFRSADAAQTFRFVAGELKTIESGKRAEVTFQLAGAESETPIHVTIERIRATDGATTTCKLDTTGNLLPCGALMPLVPWLSKLGSDASFCGTVNLTLEAAAAEINGSFTQVNLDDLVSAAYPQHKLTGLADIKLDKLRLAHGKIVEAAGTLQSPGGVIDRTFLSALQRQLDLDPADESPLIKDPRIRYRQFAFGFRLDQEGLSLSGDASPANAGVIMSNASAILLVEPPRPVAPVAYLVRVLSPESSVQIPATQEAKSLLDWLPLPTPTGGDESSTPRAKNIRLTDRPKR
jgi:hypothetical protein